MGAGRAPWAGTSALVTGASSGIGAAMARQLAAAGGVVTLSGRDVSRLDAVAAECRSAGGRVAAIAGDLTDGGIRERLVATAVELGGGVDLLVNNAGLTMNACFVELAPEVLRRIVEVDFFAAVELTRLALPSLRRRHGRILVVSSITGVVTPPTRTAYAAAKHALHGFFGALRIELRGDGVGVTIACPGYVDTPMRTRAVLGDGREQGRDQATGRRMLGAEEVAAASLRATARGKRLILLGRETRLARLLSLTAPALLDRILAGSTR
jgi:short-subunit dehydrogenase